ncbi:MAG: transporter [Gemmatimonadales bacterium]
MESGHLSAYAPEIVLALGRIQDAVSRLVSVAFLLVCLAVPARAQDIEPRAYSNAPVGVNFLVAGYADGRGSLSFDSAVPLTDAHLATPSAVLAYARVLDLWGKSAKVDAIMPYTWLSGTALYSGAPVERTVNGFADPRLRLSVNLYGAPALALQDFRSYRQRLIVGTSLQVSAPVGQYDPTRLVNISSHRWWFKPEVGVSRATGPWTLELMAAATFFTENHAFFNGNTRAQAPVYSTQVHVIRGFRSGVWASADATYFTGGRTTINGDLNNDLQQNWRVGGVMTFPVSRPHQSIKLQASFGVSARTGNNFNQFGAAWQYRWGGGV